MGCFVARPHRRFGRGISRRWTRARIRWSDPADPIPQANAWHDLAVESPGSVWFRYQVAAGRPGQAGGEAIRNSNRPWFWAQANGDFDGNGTLSTFEVTSEKPEVFRHNENE